MLEQIEPLCERLGFAKKARLRLGPASKPVGDIDLLVWTPDGRFAIALSLKWFNGPDSVREVASHDKQHRDGIAKHRTHIDYLRANAEKISKDFAFSGDDCERFI